MKKSLLKFTQQYNYFSVKHFLTMAKLILLLFFCFGLSLCLSVDLNQHTCKLNRRMLLLICPYMGHGQYTPDRDLSGVHNVVFLKFETGKIEIPQSYERSEVGERKKTVVSC